ncbi:MAG TPA: DUF3352 domain-containing protein [Candidatus Limnocylindrales bacterium]|nr:DUF3352 domain-containing protein [Candidatus Limnocylindrales bacterium]
MTAHHTGGGEAEPRSDSGAATPDQTTRWTAPGGPAISPLPPVEPSAAYDTPPGRPSAIRRWLLPLVGLVVVGLIAAALVVVVLNMQPTADAGATRAGYEYLPDRATIALELRLDLPGDQRQQLFSFVSRLPDMQGAAEVEEGLRELVEEAVADMTDGSGSYRDDVEPWFEGWMVVGMQLPENLMSSDEGAFVGVFGSRDRGLAEQAMIRLRPAAEWSAEAGPGGREIWTGRDRFDDGDLSGYAVTDDAVVFGASADDVRRALEVKAGNLPSLLEVSRFGDALDRQPTSRMGMFWLDMEALQDVLGSMPGGMMASPFQCDELPQPRGMTGSLYMREGRAVIDVVADMPEGSSLPQMRDSGLARHLPADTFFLTEIRDVGESARKTLDCLRKNPTIGHELRDIEEGMGQRIDQLIGWAGDVAIAARYDGNRATGGLLIRVTDQGRANESMGQLRALITAMGGSDVTVREEDYNGARLVSFDLGEDFGNLAEPPLPTTSLAYAFRDDLLVIGVDASFARAVLDAEGGANLADTDAYREAIEAAGGASNGGQVYVSLVGSAALLDAALRMAGGDMMDEQLADFREVLGSMDSLAMVSRVDGEAVLTRMVLSAREP